MSTKRNNRLEKEIMKMLADKTLPEVMEEFAGRDVYILEKPYDKLCLLQVKKGTLAGIELMQWFGKVPKLRIGIQNIGELSASSNNTEFNQYFWTFDEAVAEMKAIMEEAKQ